MAIVVPAVTFPVWLVGPDGREELVLDANGYIGAVSAGAMPFSTLTPSKSFGSDRGIALSIIQTNHSSSQMPPGKTR